jgi:serine phosphatase RsbU (regulator of sigma subunit)
MYFGNASGVLEYDGINWNLIPVENHSLIRSIAIDNAGTIYIGAVGELGCLIPDSKGILIYKSLMDLIPKEERDFADVWKTYSTTEGIYFQTFTKLFLYKDGKFKLWKPETSFHFSFYAGDKLYINERERGLKTMTGGQLKMVKDGEFSAGLRIYSMLTLSENELMLATREKGLYKMKINPVSKDSAITYFPCLVNQHLVDGQVYGGIGLLNDRYAFATLLSGVIITDLSGNVLQSINKGSGLQDDNIKSLYSDREHDLWIALGNGISRAEISSPLTFINDAHGLKGSVEDIIKSKNRLYVATSLGVYTSDESQRSKANNTHFTRVQGLEVQTWSLLNFVTGKDTILLAISEAGLFTIKGDKASQISEHAGYKIYQSEQDPARLYIGRNDGLASLLYHNGKWLEEDYIKSIEKEIRSIQEDKQGNLWLGTPFDGLLRISFSSAKDLSQKKEYNVRIYDTASGLPDMLYIIPNKLNDNIIFGTTRGIFEFDESQKKFYQSRTFPSEIQQRQIFRFVPKDSTTIWIFNGGNNIKETGIAYLQNNGTYNWYSKPFGKISEREIHAIFPEHGNITWLGGPEGLLKFNNNIKKDFTGQFYSLIRNVSVTKDSIVFGGVWSAQKGTSFLPSINQPKHQTYDLPYSHNSIQFEYTATSYSDEKSNLYNVFLEGFDENWSGWNNKSSKEYTSLSEGTYTFHVKAKNIYGTESIESTYRFTILPPWYRTVWACIAYVIAFICFVYLMIQLSIRRLKKAKTQLEATVKERTAEVVKQKEEIEIQKSILESKNKDITDSINYAQRIQRSLLASNKLLEKNLKDHFIFFQPKDIVSGDFYWASELSNDSFAFVTADSTGHGVPGAIMSMLNISCLNEAVNGNRLTAPNEILNYTRRKIIEHLSNDGSAEGGKDGMDCSVICLDNKKKELTFSAANNPVWIIRNNEIIEFAPDKMPVGKHDNDSISFREQKFQLQENDMIYTLTDGLPDQFGGPKGKKFMYRQLKELLISVNKMELKQQKTIIADSLNRWKGEAEQIDDICLVGIRI